MTEVTKVCPGCGGLTRIGNSRLPMTEWPDCPTCSGTGRVPFDAAKEWAAMPADIRLAMAKAAPKVAGRWARLGGYDHEVWSRQHGDLVIVWFVDGSWVYKVYAEPENLRGSGHADPRSAQAAADAELLRLGYVLDDGEGP